MSYVINTTGTSRVNFLDSEVGLVLKTAQIPASMGVADGTKKIVPAGTVFPATGAATGIVFHDVDVTSGDVAGSIMVAGRVLAERLSGIDESAKAALKDIKFVAANEVER